MDEQTENTGNNSFSNIYFLLIFKLIELFSRGRVSQKWIDIEL